MNLVSSVLHNRLDINMMLQCDVTIIYVRGAIFPFTDESEHERFRLAYCTYNTPALPPGPICNPSSAAVRAALNPADSSYIFFITDDFHDFYFGETWDDHLANLAAAYIRNQERAEALAESGG